VALPACAAQRRAAAPQIQALRLTVVRVIKCLHVCVCGASATEHWAAFDVACHSAANPQQRQANDGTDRWTDGPLHRAFMQPVASLSACLLDTTEERYKSGCTSRDAVRVVDSAGTKEPCIRWALGSHQEKLTVLAGTFPVAHCEA